MTTEDPPAEGFAARMAFARWKDPADKTRRTHVRLRLLMVMLAWVVLVPILVVDGLITTPRHESFFFAAALLSVLGPFVAAVIATRNQRFGAGGAYIVLTFLMIVPALAIARIG